MRFVSTASSPGWRLICVHIEVHPSKGETLMPALLQSCFESTPASGQQVHVCALVTTPVFELPLFTVAVLKLRFHNMPGETFGGTCTHPEFQPLCWHSRQWRSRLVSFNKWLKVQGPVGKGSTPLLRGEDLRAPPQLCPSLLPPLWARELFGVVTFGGVYHPPAVEQSAGQDRQDAQLLYGCWWTSGTITAFCLC